MITLLLTVLICGVIAWVIYSIPMPDPFKTIAIAILVIIILIAVFQVVFGIGPIFPVRR
jgi:hypothetical protein